MSRLTGTDKAELRRVLLDPYLFASRILRHDVWETPKRVLRSVRDNPRTAVKACHASSKTFTAAEAVLWWFTIYPDGIVITTAPTWTQVSRLLWGEVHKAVERSVIEFPTLSATELKAGKNNFAIGISTNQGVRFQGWHGRVLIVLDEAPGVLPEIWEAIEGVRAGGDVRILALGNPVVGGGPFYDAFTTARQFWSTFTVDGLDTPNTWGLGETPDERLEAIVRAGDAGDQRVLDYNPRPYLITRQWIYEKYHEWGPGDSRFQSRCRGQFPDMGPDAFLPLSVLEAARDRVPFVYDDTQVVSAGVDVAGPGEDETTLTVRRGGNILKQAWWAGDDPRGAVLNALGPYKQQILDTGGVVNVDENGMGYYFMLHLRDNGFPTVGINVGSTEGVDRERYRYLKDQVYWGARDRFLAGEIAGLKDDRTISQFTTMRWKENARGQIEIESKESMRARGLPSPDRAESVILALIPPPRKTRRPALPPSVSRVTHRA